MIMKHFKITLVLICLANMAFAQKNYGGVKKGSALGFSANLVDFTAEIPKVGPVSPGFSVMYWQGISKNFDFSVRYNGLFSDYSKDPVDEGSYINELEASVHLRFQGNDHLLIPFLTAGIGAGNYGKSNIAPYVPLGLGLQLNMANEGYIFLQANYRLSLSTDNLDDNMFYSLGFAQNIRSTEAYVPPPPPPMPAPVLDTDKDGILDDVDKCPTVPGVAKYNGCPIPDTDGDGINDEEDKCPTVAGIAKYQGCPIPDTDGDGINDEEDKCPTVPGLPRYQGCPIPDTDGDGVNDEEDKCPNRPGVASNLGCPEITFYYKRAVAALSAADKKMLDSVVSFMNNNPTLNIIVEGYTSNTGTEKFNQALSEKRAANSVKYIISKGIDKGRLSSVGFGETSPVEGSDQKTEAGRAQNRRSIMRINKE
jgi:OmpA-OmpF porin, OOP family